MRRSKRRYLLKLLRIMQFRQHHRTWVRGNLDAVSLAQNAQLRFTIDPSLTLMTMGCFVPENMGKYGAQLEKYRELAITAAGADKLVGTCRAQMQNWCAGTVLSNDVTNPVNAFIIDSYSEALSGAKK